MLVRRKAPAVSRGPKTPPHRSLARYSARVGFLFTLPWLLGFVLFKAIPILAALVFSFMEFDMLEPEKAHFIGLGNYVTFLGDTSAGASLFGSLQVFLMAVPLQMGIALLLAALFASDRLRAKPILRTLFFMPSIIPAIAIFIIMLGLTYPGSGWLNRLILDPLELPPIAPGSLFMPVLALWSIGPSFLIMLGAIQAVPKEIYEAARVDGAGPINRFVSVTLPMISPAIFFSLVINMISAFGGVALLDRGLPYSQSLSPMEGYIVYNMFSLQELGYASALSWVMFLVVMALTLLIFRSARYWVHFPEEEANEEI